MEDFFKQFFNRTYRPITKGEVFTIPQGSSSDNQGVSFKVVAVEPSSPAIIGDGTGFCYEEEPVKRMDSGESDKIWYDNIGGLRSQIDSINGFINMKLKISESFEDKRSPTCKVPRGIVLYGPVSSHITQTKAANKKPICLILERKRKKSRRTCHRERIRLQVVRRGLRNCRERFHSTRFRSSRISSACPRNPSLLRTPLA